MPHCVRSAAGAQRLRAPIPLSRPKLRDVLEYRRLLCSGPAGVDSLPIDRRASKRRAPTVGLFELVVPTSLHSPRSAAIAHRLRTPSPLSSPELRDVLEYRRVLCIGEWDC